MGARQAEGLVNNSKHSTLVSFNVILLVSWRSEFNLGANASQLNLSATKVKSFPADLFLDFVCLVEQLLVKVLALDPDEGLDGLADQLAVRFQLLGLAPQLLVPVDMI